jgi:hypothetical protein
MPRGGFDIDRAIMITLTLGTYLYSEPMIPDQLGLWLAQDLPNTR